MFGKRKRPAKQAMEQQLQVELQGREAQCVEGAVGSPAIAGEAADPSTHCAAPSPPRGRRTAAERARLAAEFEASGQSAESFAESIGVRPSSIERWVREARRIQQAAPARFSRRFSADERRQAVEGYLKSQRTCVDFARMWGCSASSLTKWVKRYHEEGPKGLEPRRPGKGRRAHHPSRLPDAVREQIVEVARKHPEFGVQRLTDELRRFGGVAVSAGSVRNVLREAGIEPQAMPKGKRRVTQKPPRRFERARPGELWQSDITSYVLRRQGRRVYLTVFLDDHSRFVVAWALATHQRTPLVTEPLLEGIARFGKPKEVLTDQGRQYFAWRGKSAFQKLLDKEGIAHVVSRTHHPETLGKCERLWKSVGEEFWDRAKPQDLDDARRRLGHWIAHYNFFRPHQGIDGMLPADRFFGAESTLRTALEKELSDAEIRLALDEAPRKPVYLAGQIGDQRIALHGERGRLVIDTPDAGRRELAMEQLGIQNVDKEAASDGVKRAANSRFEPESDRSAQSPPHPHGSQADQLPEDAATGMAGEGPVGGRSTRSQGASSSPVHPDPGVLAGQEEQAAGREGTRGQTAAGLAALAEGTVGDDGGPSGPASTKGESADLRGTQGRVATGAQAANLQARDRAVEDRRPGACPQMCTVDEPRLGIELETRFDPCETRTKEEGSKEERHEKSGSESDESCARRSSRSRAVWRWLTRSE